MMTTVRERLTSAVNPSIPNVSPTASRLLSALMNDEVPLAELERQIEQYPVVAARLIAVANSAWSAPQDEILSVQRACARLGLNVVRSVAIAFTISSPFDPTKSAMFDLTRFWCSGMLMADAAAALSRSFQIDPQVARTGGLIRHLGLLWLADQAPSLVDSALDAAETDAAASLNELLIASCHIGYLEASSVLFRAWNMPATLVQAVWPQAGDADPLASLLQIASELTAALYQELDADCLQVAHASMAAEPLRDTYQQLLAQTVRTKELAHSMFM